MNTVTMVADAALQRARSHARGMAKVLGPPVAEFTMFFYDLLRHLFRDVGPGTSKCFARELVHEQATEYPVIRDGVILLCRKTLEVYAERGTNRRHCAYRYAYRPLTEEEKTSTAYAAEIAHLLGSRSV